MTWGRPSGRNPERERWLQRLGMGVIVAVGFAVGILSWIDPGDSREREASRVGAADPSFLQEWGIVLILPVAIAGAIVIVSRRARRAQRPGPPPPPPPPPSPPAGPIS